MLIIQHAYLQEPVETHLCQNIMSLLVIILYVKPQYHIPKAQMVQLFQLY